MRIRDGYIINRLGSGYVVVAVGEAGREFNGMIRLNAAGAFLWEQIRNGADTKEKLVQAMLDYYDGLDPETARRDLEEFLGKASFALDGSKE